MIRPFPECGARRSHGSESDGGGRWLEGFGCSVNRLAGGYGVRRNFDRSAMQLVTLKPRIGPYRPLIPRWSFRFDWTFTRPANPGAKGDRTAFPSWSQALIRPWKRCLSASSCRHTISTDRRPIIPKAHKFMRRWPYTDNGYKISHTGWGASDLLQ